ncbi:MAG TPA: GNAT family N-acetyltransferase [Candidatus Limnocylindrales bacterium]|nr:GNAT family N-acetyltransferase [Candidatus Limnocylindrales bacterium]
MQLPPSERPPLQATPVTLEGDAVRLEPLSREHLDGLAQVALDPELWRWTIVEMRARADLEAWLEDALRGHLSGRELPFAIIERAGGQAVGSTRYLNIEPAHLRLEIGWTWLARPWQRTAANTEAKLLLLEHAFERLGAMRVEFKTDSLNEPSRRALLGIGAVEEGVFRNHMRTPSGRLRHSAYYSIIEDDWPAVRERLRARLARHARATTGA